MGPTDIPRPVEGLVGAPLLEHLPLHVLSVEPKNEPVPQRPLPGPGIDVHVLPAVMYVLLDIFLMV